MTNTIRVKRGLSSNVASASLVEGELALTTDTLELYTSDGEKNVKITQKGPLKQYKRMVSTVMSLRLQMN